MATMKLTDGILAGPAADGVRAVASGFLDAAQEAHLRMDDPKDAEALHDFRVSLRRLRSSLRFYGPLLSGALKKKHLRRLKKVAAATNPGRDAEVQAAYLRDWEPLFSARLRHGVSLFRTLVEGRRDAAYAAGVGEARAAFQGLEPVLRSVFSPPAEVRGDGPPPARGAESRPRLQPPFGLAAGEAVLCAADDLRKCLYSIHPQADAAIVHSARIAGKRLRYLLEPFQARSPAWTRCVKALKSLQDILGELHDMHVLSLGISEAAEAGAVAEVRRRFALKLAPASPQGTARRKDPLPGLIRLAKHVRDRERFLHRRLFRCWGDVRRARFFGETAALAESLRRIRPHPHTKETSKP